MYRCQQNLMSMDKHLKAILEFICAESHQLTNCGIYYARQLDLKTQKIIGKFDLDKEYKNNKHYQVLSSQAAQQILKSIAESLKSFKELNQKSRKGELTDKPHLPKYIKKEGLFLVTYPKQALKWVDNQIRIPLGKTVKQWFGLDSFYLPTTSNLRFQEIKELRILPRNHCFYVEFVYESKPVEIEVNPDNVLGLDSGLNNWLTGVSSLGTSFVIDGRHLKSVNRWYHKQVATLKEGKPQGFWSTQLAKITEKRNRKIRDAVNKAARLVINQCLEHQRNKDQKEEGNLGKKNHQSFVSIATAKLKKRMRQLCEQCGIKFIETEESYTSKASFLDNDSLPKFVEKPEGWQPSGKRTKRGLYRTAQNQYINADANGAANIIRKVSTTLNFDLSVVSRGVLTRPQKFQCWSAKKTRSPLGILRHLWVGEVKKTFIMEDNYSCYTLQK
ncbi:RNA-guided endonuclease InsQ/TnpB family protein [Microcystis aeruginosa]|uniref:RNA-guided endonuclease InsQ/TnpB family protein n=1 Tax=Microcystis aeruginosa TaxID=1126 RepID=UPI0007766B05|nr:RNA-guided endonuclease TnpB family protein [Microcystis aeruginosa]KXS88994.1 transposase [Microcystis aeruginosa NIES-88]BCU11363.1 transposase [Microcystis aeruginosa]